jgi:hypothetical protein
MTTTVNLTTEAVTTPPSYLDITLTRLRHGGVCSCGHRLSPGDRAGWARSTREFVCLPCVKRSLWNAVDATSIREITLS